MGGKDGTCADVRLIECVRLIWAPLNTGLTVTNNMIVQDGITDVVVLLVPQIAKLVTLSN